MKHEGRRRRTPSQWLSDDLSKMNRPGTLGRTIKRHPIILLQGLAFGLAACGVLAVGLAALGKISAFGDNVFFAIIAIGPFVGARIHSYQQQNPDED